MLFKKDRQPKGKKKDMEDIKRLVDEIQPEPEADIVEEPMPEDLMPIQEAKPPEIGAPLFVKVEKYRELLSGLQEMKLFVSSVKDIFSIMQEVESIRSDALNVLKVTVQRLEKSVIEIDTELLRPRGMTTPLTQGESEVRHIESSLSELQQQLVELKRDLQNMGS